MSTLKMQYGASNQAMTITLASLANSGTVGRAGTAIDNTTNLFLDALVQGLIEVGTVASPFQAYIYAYGTADGGASYGGKNGANVISGTDGGITLSTATDLRLLGVLTCPTSSIVYSFGPYSVAKCFDGILPDHWGIAVLNNTGAALSATAGNNKAFYQGLYNQNV